MNPQQIARIVQNEINKGLSNVNEKTFYRGIVTAASGNKANVRLEGASNPVMNIICLEGYTPTAGDQVIVVSIGRSGSNYFVLGKTDLDYIPPEAQPDYNLLLRLTGADAFTAASSTMTKIPFAYKMEDTHNIWDAANKQIRIPFTGIYLLSTMYRAENTSGVYRYIIRTHVNGQELGGPDGRARTVNDMMTAGSGQTGTNNPGVPGGTIQMYLKKDDILYPNLWHNVGSTRSYTANTNTVDTYLTLSLITPLVDDPYIAEGSFTNYLSVYWFSPEATLTRDTSNFRTSPAAMRVAAASGVVKSAHYYGQFLAGKTYKLTYYVRANAATTANILTNFGSAATSPVAVQIGSTPLNGTNWVKCEYTYTPTKDYNSFEIRTAATVTQIYIDDVSLEEV